MRARYFIRISGTRARCPGQSGGAVPLACEDWIAELGYPLNFSELQGSIASRAEEKGIANPELDLVQRLGLVVEGGQDE